MSTEWKIDLFAGLSERFGVRSLIIETAEQNMTAADLKNHLMASYPLQADILSISFLACNHAYAQADSIVNANDELALLPPVSGGQAEKPTEDEQKSSLEQWYMLTNEKITTEEVLAKVIVPEHGASLAFVGTTREWTKGQRTVRLEYEAYEPMAVKMMKQIGDELAEKWPGTLCAITHRLGVVDIAETSVVIAISSPHRASCYDASRYAIERLKQMVPIWKKEIWEDGSEWKGHQLGPWNPDTPLADFPDET
ncbi:molybdopterin synthase catalytic subunit [Paenibacillus algorifonticola]|uniref:Molybdopterin synthase catalytic subunit n=1 Tax=Paenibacillus algorifonticola TaxID=684063 RepID=A0A1I2B671_9BACL|nr:molybdenum cofactor biosynthesis protein MoaE [Paenibacillus algorifonticola]SFE51408.1 molybdopterin synthase catalytic subunit [Paenibacillus algorifonticola]